MQNSLAGLSLRDLEYAEAVAELKHFGRAAERCGVSQPALSEQIRKLESYLGCALFERTRRRVALTAQGGILLQQIERILGTMKGEEQRLLAQRIDAASNRGAWVRGLVTGGALLAIAALLWAVRLLNQAWSRSYRADHKCRSSGA